MTMPRTGEVLTNCQYESYKINPHTKVWSQSRSVVLIKYTELMRNPGASFLARLESDSRDWVDLVEFYTSAQTSLVPSNADKLFGPSAIHLE